jgi:hypothetical protein
MIAIAVGCQPTKAEIAAETQVAERDWLLKHADLLITQSSSLAS